MAPAPTARNLSTYFIGGSNSIIGYNQFNFLKDDYFFAYLTTNLGGNILKILDRNLIVTVIADGTTTSGSRAWNGAVGVTALPFLYTGYSFGQIIGNDSTWLSRGV
jgi:hypothetical protein